MTISTPSRIVVGLPKKDDATKADAELFALLLLESALEKNVPYEHNGGRSVHLFANTYLAIHVSYFNEFDTCCELNGLNTR